MATGKRASSGQGSSGQGSSDRGSAFRAAGHRTASGASRKSPGGQRRGAPPPAPPKPWWYRLRWPALGVALLVVLLVIFARRDASIGGVVQDAQTQTNIVNAMVQLDNEPPVSPNIDTGAFTFGRVRPGNHSVIVRAPGYRSQTVTFVLKSGQNQKLNVLMPAVPPPVKKLTGRVVLVGLRNPSGVAIWDSALKLGQTIKLPDWPNDGAAAGEKLFLAESTKDQIDVIDLNKGNIIKTIPLPRFSGPMRLQISPDKRLLLVLNTVAKNLTVVDTQNYEIRQTIALPAAAVDMKLTADGSGAIVAGPSGLVNVSYAGGLAGPPLPFPTGPNGGMDVVAGNGQILLPGGNTLTMVDAFTGKAEPLTLGTPSEQLPAINAEQVAAIDTTQVLLAGGGYVWRYNLAQRSVSGEPFNFKLGEVLRLTRFGDKFLMATRGPEALYLLDPAHLASSSRLNQSGQPQFILEHQL
ncbi:MAG: carboxypeptidase regulatory-like domain-containing protein [Candidatus Sericytochromatia bacterium]